MNKLKFQIILGSTRDGRAGEAVAKWVLAQIRNRNDFEFEFIDLKDWNLPLIHDAIPPGAIKDKYPDPLIQKWAEKISEADAYLIVTPEYNHGYTAVLKNALDVIYKEWNNKPVAFVSYGNIAGGSRSVEQLRLVSIELQMAPIREAVHIPLIWQAFENNELKNKVDYDKKLDSMLTQLIWWAKALKSAR